MTDDQAAEVPALIRHLESHLGMLEHALGFEDGVNVGVWLDRPFRRAQTFVSIGLSRQELHQERGPHVAQELVFTCYRRYPREEVAALVTAVAHEVGEVLGPHGPLLEGSTTEALWSMQPVYFPESFSSFDDPSRQRIVLVWLVPLTAAEAAFASDHGWKRLEGLFVENDPDLCDLNRASVPGIS